MITRIKSIPVLINMFNSPFIFGVFSEESGDILSIVEPFKPCSVPALGRHIHFVIDVCVGPALTGSVF